ncbi:MAG: hypothetical protein ABIR18_05200, partial [Chitinophagaceae bacterium]
NRSQQVMVDAENDIRTKSQKQKLMTVASLEAFGMGMVKSLNQRGFLVSDMYEVYPSFMRFSEPVFLLQVKYLDTSRYVIKTIEQYLRDENAPELRTDFTYNTPNTMRAFIREAPFVYNWDFLPNEYEISINDKKYTTTNRFLNNKIFSVEGKDINIKKPNSVPYLIVIQEIEEKKPL